MNAFAHLCLALMLLGLEQPAAAVLPYGEPADAPPLRHCPLAAQQDLGDWDDVFACDRSGLLVLSRDDAFQVWSPAGDSPLIQRAALPQAQSNRIVGIASTQDKLWLFFQPIGIASSPAALDLLSGELVLFEIPGVKLTGLHSLVVLPHCSAALLMIPGGDSTYPRRMNRPVYFWFGLHDGATKQLPVGWDFQLLGGPTGGGVC